MTRLLVTGAAGFIGHALCKRLLTQGARVFGVDAVTPYYDVRLKEARLRELERFDRFELARFDLSRAEETAALFRRAEPELVVHLAAQPGVRYSLEHPLASVQANVVAFAGVLEACRTLGVRHLVYASSSSVYGGNTKVPFSVGDRVDHPVSVYAATKKSNELMAHVYSHVYGLPATGLRFFTVYGPWGRPDMAPMLFTKAILEGEPIRVFNHGRMRRDFTYVDDVVEALVRVIARPPALGDGVAAGSAAAHAAPYRLYNIGNSTPVDLLVFIETLERLLGREARKVMEPMQAGDVPVTCADVADLERELGFRPRTSLDDGLARMVDWYRSFYELRGRGRPRVARASAADLHPPRRRSR